MKIEDMIDNLAYIDGLEDVVGYLRAIESIDDSNLVLAILQEVTDEGVEEDVVMIPCDLTEIHLQIMH